MNRSKWRQRLLAVWPPALLAIAFLAVWEFGVRVSGVEKWLIPAPSDIVAAFGQNVALVNRHMWPTLQEAVLGFVTGIAVALILAILIELSPWLRQGLYPLLVGTQTVPIIAIAPLFIVWFGYGLLPKVLIVALVTFFPVVISTVDGLSSADRDMVRLLQSMGAGRWRIFRMVRFPHALPYVFSGLKIAATYSVLGAVIAEWLGANAGLGVMLVRAQNSFAADLVFVAIVVITFWSVVLFALIQTMSRLLAPWAYMREEEQWKGKDSV